MAKHGYMASACSLILGEWNDYRDYWSEDDSARVWYTFSVTVTSQPLNGDQWRKGVVCHLLTCPLSTSLSQKLQLVLWVVWEILLWPVQRQHLARCWICSRRYGPVLITTTNTVNQCWKPIQSSHAACLLSSQCGLLWLSLVFHL